MKPNKEIHHKFDSEQENIDIRRSGSDITPNDGNLTQMNLFTDQNTPDDAIEIVMVPNIMKLEGMTKDIEQQAVLNTEFQKQIDSKLENQMNNFTKQQSDDKKELFQLKYSKQAKCLRYFKYSMLFILVITLIIATGAQLTDGYAAHLNPPQAWPRSTKFNNSDIITFELGGNKSAKIVYGQLLQVKGSKLATKFSTNQSVQEDGTVYINRPYLPFKLMLDFLKNNMNLQYFEDEKDLNILYLELDFWNIPRHKPTKIQEELVKIYAEKPSNKDIQDATMKTWTKLGIFDINAYINTGNVTLLQEFQIQKLSYKNLYDWVGQSHLLSGHGMGRNQGGFGIYEGNFDSGLPNGFGRLIWRNGNWFLGNFVNGAITGQGEYHMNSIKRTFKGLWSDSVLVSSYFPDEMKGLKIQEPIPPQVQIPGRKKINQIDNVLSGSPDVSDLKITTLNEKKQWGIVNKQWKKLGPLNINRLAELKYVKIDDKIPVRTINSDNSNYKGQAVEQPIKSSKRLLKTVGKSSSTQTSNPASIQLTQYVSEGFGRQVGLWGIYEGMFKDGVVSGYGRMIHSNQNVYEGTYLDALYNGTGKLSLANGTIIQGTWKLGKLIQSIKTDGSEGYTAKKLEIPKVARVRSKLEQELTTMFSLAPLSASTAVNKIFNQLGPFKIDELIGSRTLSMNAYKNLTFGKSMDQSYEGQQQVLANITKFTQMNKATALYMNWNNVSTSVGFGRIINKNYTFDGLIDIDANQLFGRVIWSQSLDSYDGQLICLVKPNQVCRGSYFISSTGQKIKGTLDGTTFKPDIENMKTEQIQMLFNSRQLLMSDSVLSQLKTSFQEVPKGFNTTNWTSWNLQDLMFRQMVVDDKNSYFSTKTNVDKNGSFAQFIGQGKVISGLGRVIQANSMYEGQFTNNQLNGYGRHVFKNGTVHHNGFWKEGKYVATNSTMFQLLQLFGSKPDSQILNKAQLQRWAGQDIDLLGLMKSKNISITDNNLMNKNGGMMLNVSTLTLNNGSTIIKGVMGINQNILLGRAYNVNGTKATYFEGLAGVYGLSIYPDGSYCKGYVDNGYQKCVDINGDVQNGLWKNNKFMGRPQKYDEIKLEGQLDHIIDPPMFLNALALKKYNELGPLDFRQLIDQKKLTYVSNIKSQYKQVAYGLGKISSLNWTYHGQLPHYQGELIQAQGVGRVLADWGIYEGQVVAGQFQGYGRIILNNQQVYSGQFTNMSVPAGSKFVMPKGLQQVQRKVNFAEQQLQKIFTSPVNEAVVPIENKFIKKLDFLPESLSGDLNFDVSYWISWGFLPGVSMNNSISLSDIIGQNFYYAGEVAEETDKITGWGRLQTSQGLFDGFQSKNGTQAGRLILPSKDSYEGEMKNWKFDGPGRFVQFSSGLIYEGEWKNNKLIKSKQNASAEGFENKQTFEVQPLIRLQTSAEKAMIKIFNQPLLDVVPAAARKMWKPFNFQRYCSQYGLVVSDTAKMFRSLDGRYNGQIQNSSDYDIYYARYQGSWGVYEGEFQNGTSLNFGRLIRPTGQSITGFQFDKYPWDGVITVSQQRVYDGPQYQSLQKTYFTNVTVPQVVFVTKLQYSLREMFKKPPTGIQASQTALFNKYGAFNFEQLRKNGTIQLNPKIEYVTDLTNSYWGQAQLVKRIGRATQNTPWVKSVQKGLYDGEFLNHVYQGFGQLVTVQGKNKTQGIYIGEFSNGLMHGKGKMQFAKGSPKIGIWKYGNFVGNENAEYLLYKAVNQKPMNVSSTIQKYWTYQKPLDMLNQTNDKGGWRNESKLNLIKIQGNQSMTQQNVNKTFSWYGQSLNQSMIVGVLQSQDYYAYGQFSGSSKMMLLQGLSISKVNKTQWVRQQGYFKNGVLNGFGIQKSFSTNKTVEGWWQNGTYVSSLYVHNLDVIMQTPPVNVDKQIAKTWKSLGPFSSYNVTSEKPKLVNSKTYQGQDLEMQKTMPKMPAIGRKISSNQLIEGQFLKNQSSGMTRIINSKGYYLGNMKSDQRNGQGTLSNTLGSYKGNWLNNKKQGFGKLSYGNKTTLDGYWNNDTFWHTENWFNLAQNLSQAPDVKSTKLAQKWKSQGSFNVQKIANQYKDIKIDYTFKIVKTDINSTTSFIGQSSMLKEYVGRYIIKGKTTTVIEGIFIKDMNTGFLRKYLDNGTMQQGYWNNSKYYLSFEMYSLQKIFAIVPSFKGLSSDATSKWKKLGMFDIQAQLSQLEQVNKLDLSMAIANVTTAKSSFNGQKNGVGQKLSTSIQEGLFSNMILNGFGREIYTDGSYYIGFFKNGLKDGQGTFINKESKNITQVWKAGEFDCSKQLSIRYVRAIKLDYSNSTTPVMLNQTTSSFINPGNNLSQCPVISCSLKTSPGCKTDYASKDVTLKDSKIYVMTNVEAGFTGKQVCLVCKNKDQTATQTITISQSKK